MRRTEQSDPSLRITVNPTGVLRVEGRPGKQSQSLELAARLMPAIQRLHKEIRRTFED